MALTQEEEQRIRELLAKEDEQKKQSVFASKENLKKWLQKVARGILGKISDTTIDYLFNKLPK